MNDLVINISWEFFLSLLGSIIALVYYANGRFTRLETNVDWLSDALRELTIRAENISAKMFDNGSPVALTKGGQKSLEQSGLKSYIDARRHDFIAQLRRRSPFDRYGTQDAAFRLFSRLAFEGGFARHLNTFAYQNGLSTDLLRRIGAIYLRDLALKRD